MAAAQPSPYYHAILWTGEHVTVYTPEKPRTVGHLVLRTGVKTFADLSKEAHLEIMTLAQKVKSIKPQLDFVIYWTKRDGELLTEILPQRSAGKALNAMDKLSVNKHIFCPEGITDDIKPSVRSTQVARDRQSWQGALTLAPNLPQMEDTKGSWKLEISHLDDAVTMARWGLRQILGSEEPGVKPTLTAVDQPSDIVEKEMGPCPFCKPEVLAKQTIVSSEGVRLLYNIQGNDRFLLIPERHCPNICYLNPGEVTAMYNIEQRLRQILGEENSSWQIVTLEQGGPAVGQSVRHAHLQIVPFDPEMIEMQGLTAAVNNMSKAPKIISDQEMAQTTQYYREKMMPASS